MQMVANTCTTATGSFRLVETDVSSADTFRLVSVAWNDVKRSLGKQWRLELAKIVYKDLLADKSMRADSSDTSKDRKKAILRLCGELVAMADLFLELSPEKFSTRMALNGESICKKRNGITEDVQRALALSMLRLLPQAVLGMQQTKKGTTEMLIMPWKLAVDAIMHEFRMVQLN